MCIHVHIHKSMYIYLYMYIVYICIHVYIRIPTHVYNIYVGGLVCGREHTCMPVCIPSDKPVEHGGIAVRQHKLPQPLSTTPSQQIKLVAESGDKGGAESGGGGRALASTT